MSEVVEVVRIEDAEGIGPWQSIHYYEIYHMLNRRFQSKKHRVHEVRKVDMKYYSIKDFLFGFETHDDLVAYFGKRLIDMMLRRGFVIKTYKTEKKYILHGKGEIAFPKPGIIPKPMEDPFAQMYTQFTTPVRFKRYASLEPILDEPDLAKQTKQKVTIDKAMLSGDWMFSIDPS